MKPYLSPIPIACVLLAILGAVLSNLPLVVGALVAGIGAVGFISARHVQAERSGDPAESLSQEGRTLLRPVQRLVGDIRKLVDENQESPTITVIGGEAIEESERLVAEVAKGLQIRDDLKKSLKSRYEAEKEIGDATMKLEFAGEDERRSLQSAIETRKTELAHYDQIGGHLKRIEVGVNQAEAILAEIKAKLSLSVSQDQQALSPGDDLRESLGRMRSLSESYEEAERFLQG
jgi:hypothetical protein